ncbi:MAG TPA: alpha/beta hydrolase [Acidimicrobiales bacterium]|nr:alpha/beta hydrolase [Acidimicrobiales bacterium]
MEIRWLDVTEEQRAQARGVVESVEQLIAGLPPVHTVEPAVTRRQRAEGNSVLPVPEKLDHAVDRTIPGPAGPLPVRMIVPDEPRGVYLHVHGGGWTLGAHDQQDALLDFFATRLGVAVVSVGYRLAPEDPYPAGPDDCEAVATWLVEHAATELGSDRLLIGGESAGAHLSAVTLLRLRDRHQAAGRFLAANLVFGMYDFGLTPSVRRWGDRNLVLSTPIIEWFARCFLGETTPQDRQRPDVSPLHADLAGLPPAYFTVGALDPLLDDSLFMASRWHAAGNEAELVICPESIHGFTAFPHDIAVLSLVEQAGFLGRHLAKASP